MPILTRTDLTEQRLTGALRRILGDGRPRPLSESQQKRARAVVNPEIVLLPSRAESLPLFQDPEIPAGDVIRVMDREQERVAEHLGAGYRVLRGVAGSGKTLVLAHRARHLHKHWPNWRILVLCFNRVLASALRTMVDARQAVGSHQHRPTGLPPGREKGRPRGTRPACLARHRTGRVAATDSDFDRRVLQATAAARGLPDSERFDAVLVDEAQDFDHPRLELAYAMLQSGSSATGPRPTGPGQLRDGVRRGPERLPPRRSAVEPARR